MSNQLPSLSVGGYRRGEDDQLLLGASFIHPVVGSGYVCEDGTSRGSSYGGESRLLKGIVVSFDDHYGVEPVRLEVDASNGGIISFPWGFQSAVSEAIRLAGFNSDSAEVLK